MRGRQVGVELIDPPFDEADFQPGSGSVSGRRWGLWPRWPGDTRGAITSVRKK